MIDRAAVVAEARTWIKTPYHHEAGVKGHGCDCAHLLKEVAVAAGVISPVDVSGYPSDWMKHRSEERFVEWVERYAVPASYAPPRPADLVLFKFGRCFSHGAIVTEWPMAVHAVKSDRMVVESNCLAGQFENRELRHYTFLGYTE